MEEKKNLIAGGDKKRKYARIVKSSEYMENVTWLFNHAYFFISAIPGTWAGLRDTVETPICTWHT